MQKIKNNPNVRNAIMIGSMCSLSYLAVYFARNILGAVSPQMIETGAFTTENIGTLSSIYFFTYAFGQLINGSIGDKVKAKYMISLGLCLAGVCNMLFSQSTGSPLTAYIAYGLTGFFLSMIYGPMTKVVAENTEPIYATRCTLGYTVSSFLGSPLAGVVAMFLTWQSVFSISSAALLIMGCICFIVFNLFERRGIVRYGQFVREKSQGNGIQDLLKRQIVKFTFIAIITGVVRTTVVFWLPTYLSQYLSFSSDKAAMIFTVTTFILTANSFIAVFLYEKLGHDLNKTVLIAFSAATIGFTSVFFVRQPVMNIVCLVVSIMSSNIASSMLYSRYCPSLRDTGMVSSATGFLDFCSYMSASISSTLFANAVSSIGWSGLILVWLALMVAGVIVALPYRSIFSKN